MKKIIKKIIKKVTKPPQNKEVKVKCLTEHCGSGAVIQGYCKLCAQDRRLVG